MLINVGFSGYVSGDKIVAVASPDSAPIKRKIQEGQGSVIDLSRGNRTKSVIFLRSGQIVLSALAPDTINKRINEKKGGLA